MSMMTFVATAALLLLVPPSAANDEALAHPRPVDESFDQRRRSLPDYPSWTPLTGGVPSSAANDEALAPSMVDESFDQRRRSLPHYPTYGGTSWDFSTPIDFHQFTPLTVGTIDFSPTIADRAWAQDRLKRRIAKVHRRPDTIQGAVADLVRQVRAEEHVALNANLAVLAGPLFGQTDDSGNGNDDPVAHASKTKIAKWEDCGGGWQLINAATTSELKDCKEKGCSITHSEEWNPLTNCDEAFIECVCDDEETGPGEEDDEDPAEVIAP